MKKLHQKISAETCKKLPDEIYEFAENIVKKCVREPIGIIFYGSQTQKLEKDGLIDFYLVLESLNDFPKRKLTLFGNQILPPNIYFMKHGGNRAKIACLTFNQLQKRLRVKSFDTTIWARFSQPVAFAWVQNDKSRILLNDAICHAICTASIWAALLGPRTGKTKAYLTALFSNTFKTEIRVENKKRILALIERNIDRYQTYLPLAWAESHVPFKQKGTFFGVNISAKQRHHFHNKWQLMRLWGKIQNILRLLKASLTFDGGADYIRWKVRRHTGIAIATSSYERKYPVIELPITVLKIIFSFIVQKK